MGWFEQQIKQRKKSDQHIYEESYVRLAGVIMGEQRAEEMYNEQSVAVSAVGEILKYFNITAVEVPEEEMELADQLEYLLRPSGVMHRRVELSKGWRKDANGPMLGRLVDDNRLVALIPAKFGGYSIFDPRTGKLVKINGANESKIQTTAYLFYRPLPIKEVSLKELVKFVFSAQTSKEHILFLLFVAAYTLLNYMLPKLNKFLLGDVLDYSSYQLFTGAAVFLIALVISSSMLKIGSEMVLAGINNRSSVAMESSMMMRILSLPVQFFRKTNAGKLTSSMYKNNVFSRYINDLVFNTAITSLFSLVFIAQIFAYGAAVGFPAILTLIATLALSIIAGRVQAKITERQMDATAKENGVTFSLLMGIQKIKLAGAEKRAFAKWADYYANTANTLYNLPTIVVINTALSTFITIVGEILIYYAAFKSGMSSSDYYAFNSAYGMISASFIALSAVTNTVAQIWPIYKMMKPVLDEVPEINVGRKVISELHGGIEMDNVSFRYGENLPLVLDNLSLKIKPGQYVAIVGRTGCGKSTLMRLLLGFENPESGGIYYDGRDINSMDLRSLRRKIGVVLQDGMLFQGDIFSNVTISAPNISEEEAWEAVKMAGLEDDINNMQMGMHTMINSNSGGVSGGQKQRIMIARAIAQKPNILMFDEATSALDNKTQKIVSDSLDSLKCTRIVIAHRLSTIRQCDRIIMLKNGHIIEDGTYESLMELNGEFADMVKRQQVTYNEE